MAYIKFYVAPVGNRWIIARSDDNAPGVFEYFKKIYVSPYSVAPNNEVPAWTQERSEGGYHETREAAEAKAFELAARFPAETVGKLMVVSLYAEQLDGHYDLVIEGASGNPEALNLACRIISGDFAGFPIRFGLQTEQFAKILPALNIPFHEGWNQFHLEYMERYPFRARVRRVNNNEFQVDEFQKIDHPWQSRRPKVIETQ